MLDLLSLDPKNGEEYYIVDIKSGKCIDVYGEGKHSGAALILYGLKNSENQRFKMKDCGNSEWEILPCGCSNLSVDVSGASSNNNAKMQIYSSNNSSAQRFKLKRTMDYFKIMTKCSGYEKALGTLEGNETDCTPIVQCEMSSSKNWSFKKA